MYCRLWCVFPSVVVLGVVVAGIVHAIEGRREVLFKLGVCVVPGSGFGQKPGTFHFRTTILHSREEFQHMMDSIRLFHLQFLRQYS